MTTDTVAVVRTYVVAIAAAALVALWLLLARTPFPEANPTSPKTAEVARLERPTTVDPRLAALDRRARLLQQRAKQVAARRDARWASYRAELAARNAANAAAALVTRSTAVSAPSIPQVSIPSTPSAPPATHTASS